MEPDRGPGTAPRGTGSRRPPRAWSPAGKTETHGEVTGTEAERGQGWRMGSGGGRSSQVHLGTRAAGSGDRRRCPRDGRVGRERLARQSGVRPPGSRALRAASPSSSWPGPAETPRFSACLSSFLLCSPHSDIGGGGSLPRPGETGTWGEHRTIPRCAWRPNPLLGTSRGAGATKRGCDKKTTERHVVRRG